VLNFSQSDFVIAGPGAHSGLSRLFGKDLAKIAPGLEISAIRWLQSTQNEHFQRLGLDFSGLGPEKLPLQLCDIEHALCEFDRYARIAIPTSRSHHGQMRNRTSSKRHAFEPPDVTTDTDKGLHLPKAWQHPDRQKIRIKPGKRETVTKRYLVDSIVGHRKSSSGLMEYRVHWFGYSDSDDTWQPHDELSTDAPDVVKNYLASLTSK
jgi:alpha-glutamyl/putrescinyl thymine pyrophosphorylase clade 1/Chromo (CHRromatin Organisation MOdifier) domain